MDEKEELTEEVKETVVEEPRIDQPNQSNGNGMATASMVLGIVGVFIFGLPCGILAIIFSIIAKKKGVKNGKVTTGLVLGIIDVAFAALMFIFGATFLANFSSMIN